MNDKKIRHPEANHRQRDVLKAAVENIFHEMVAKQSPKTHLTHAVVYFMELPHPRHVVQQAVHEVLHEVSENKNEGKFSPKRPRFNVNRHQVFDAEETEKVFEKLHAYHRKGVVG